MRKNDMLQEMVKNCCCCCQTVCNHMVFFSYVKIPD